MNRQQRRHPDQHPWDDFSFGGFVAGWRNPHRRHRGHTIFWAMGVAILAVLAFSVLFAAVMGLGSAIFN